MTDTNPLPILITFDGEARSGKGTIVQATKDYIRDNKHLKTMLIDAGQVFRVLVVGATQAGVDPNDPAAIDTFLSDEHNVEHCAQLVKDVYHMSKNERDALLYTNDVGRDSAKFGARPLSQKFKDSLLKKWLRDARIEGFQVVLLDGRALEEIGAMLEAEGLCEFRVGMYFICDPIVGARRTLGFAGTPYDELTPAQQKQVDELVRQINERNASDAARDVHPIIRPKVAISRLPNIVPSNGTGRPFYLIDTSADLTKQAMTLPVEKLVESYLA